MRPVCESELAEAIASARSGIRIRGGGTRQGLGNPVEAESCLDTTGLSGIRLYEPGALTLIAGAGTPLDEVESALAAHGQQLPFEPIDHRGLLGSAGEPTVGAAAACNLSGPRRIQAGACRDSLIGVRFIDGTGTVTKSGGRVMKNVTGYDLVKLLAGSFGTLGVVSEVTFRVLPAPETRAVLLIDGLSLEMAVAPLSSALGSPWGVSGAAHTPSGLDGHPVTMIRVEGSADSVAYRSERLRDHLAEFGDVRVETDPLATAAGWRWVRDAESFHGRPGDVWKVSVRPTDGPRVVRSVRLSLADVAEPSVLLDWGGGLVWLCVPEDHDIRPSLRGISGHATLVRAAPATRRKIGAFHPEPEPLVRMARSLRARFDPRNILNPGIMAGPQPENG